MLLAQRTALIEEFVNSKGYVSVEELASICNVSTQTIRRDIASLSNDNKLIKLHGGAGSLVKKDSSFSERRLESVEGKHVIGKLLGELIPNEATLFIGGGTTLETAVDYLAEREGLFVVTTNLHIALAMQKSTKSVTMTPHGEIQAGTNSLIGGTIAESLARYRMDICLISCVAIDEEGNFYETNNAVAVNNELMKKYAKRIILVADSTKFMQESVVRVGNISEVEYFITDVRPSESFCKLLQDSNVKLICP